jgi:glucose-1-phosphate thymidylyltransferase
MSICGVMVVEDGPCTTAVARSDRPAALEHVANRPIASHVLDGLGRAGVSEVILITSGGHARPVAEYVARGCESSGLPLTHVVHDEPVTLAGALRAAAPIVGSRACIVHSASGLLDQSLESLTDRLHGDEPDITVFVHQHGAGGAHLSPASQEILNLAEFDAEHGGLRLAGVWLVGPGVVPLVSDLRWCVAGEIDLTGMATRLARRSGRFDVVPVDAWRTYSGASRDLLDLNRIALDQLHADQRRPAHNGNQIEGRVWIHEDASLRSSVVVGPAVIGAGARVADAYIGPYTSIGAGAQIEGAEIERSIIFPGASVLHLGGRLVSSVVGRDARIFRDFSLPRALRLQVGDGTEVALS